MFHVVRYHTGLANFWAVLRYDGKAFTIFKYKINKKIRLLAGPHSALGMRSVTEPHKFNWQLSRGPWATFLITCGSRLRKYTKNLLNSRLTSEILNLGFRNTNW